MDAATVKSVLPEYTLYKKGKIGKDKRLVWQMDSGRLFIRRECCLRITNITTYDIAHVDIGGEIIGYSTDCLECRFCGTASHFVFDRWKAPSAALEHLFRYARKVVGDELKYTVGATDNSSGAGREWLYLELKGGTGISVQKRYGSFFPSYDRDGKSYATLAEALKAGVESFRSLNRRLKERIISSRT